MAKRDMTVRVNVERVNSSSAPSLFDDAPTRDTHILRAVHETPWAILPEKLEAIAEVVRLHAAHASVPMEAAHGPQRRAAGATAVLPLFGIIAQRMDMMTAFSGGTSTEAFAKDFRAALGDPEVGSIVIDVDSPGGSVYGVEELASEILAARGEKRIVAVANSLAASAAYWIASAADEIVVTPSGEVGSIGVVAMHQDQSKLEEEMGVKTTLISAGKHKTEGNPHEPLSEEAESAIQARVNDYYGKFTKAVAKGRGVSVGDVRGGFGEGRVVGSAEAVKVGLADRIATLDATLARVTGSRSKSKMAALDETRARRQRLRQTTVVGMTPAAN